MPILTRVLDPSAYGTASLATTFISLVSVIALAGADLSYIRAYHAEKPPMRQAVEALTWRFALASSTVAAILSALFWLLLCSVTALPPYAAPLVAAGVVFSATMAMAMARARLHDRYGAISLATVASGLGSAAIAIVVALSGQHDALPLILSVLAIYLIPVLALGCPPVAELVKPSGFSYQEGKHILCIGGAIAVTAPAYWVMSSSDRWFLQYFTDATMIGVYSISCSVAIAGMTVNNAILTIWTPEATKLFENTPIEGLNKVGSITEAMIAALACVWLAVAASGADLVHLLTPPAFHAGTAVVPFIAAGVFFHGVCHLSGTIYVLEKRVASTIFWWIVGAAANMLSCFFLVPKIGMSGAALSQVAGFAVTASGLTMGARHMLLPHMRWARMGVVFLVVFAAAILMMPAWSKYPVSSLCLKFPFGLLVILVIFSLFRLNSFDNVLARVLSVTFSDFVTSLQKLARQIRT